MDGRVNMEEKLPVRKRLRLPDYDYSSPGAYFITICTQHRRCILSRISRNTVGANISAQPKFESPVVSPDPTVGAIQESPAKLTPCGKIVDRVINQITDQYPAYVDSYVIMPNHIHLIIVITETEDARTIRESPLRGRSVISKMIGYIKMNSSKEIHRCFGDSNIWQRGFHDHVIRNRRDYEQIAKYIYENPIRWQYDCFYVEDF